MSNFDFLLSTEAFGAFARAAVAAEKIYEIDPAAAVVNCRRAMEFAVKWMYSVDGALVLPWDDRLNSLMENEDFRGLVPPDVWERMNLIRKFGNAANHNPRDITPERAMLCLENLHIFMDFVCCCYGEDYQPRPFDAALVTAASAVAQPDPEMELQLQQLM